MAANKLFRIQDPDRPMWVIAPDWTEALNKWRIQIAKENDQEISEVEEPQGIQLVCDETELLP